MGCLGKQLLPARRWEKGFFAECRRLVTFVEGAAFENIPLPEGAFGNALGIPGLADKFIEAYNEIKANLLKDNLNLSDILFVFNDVTRQ